MWGWRRVPPDGPDGIVIDGAVYALGGQPPRVQPHSWGQRWRNYDY
jgi:hypothetical protein